MESIRSSVRAILGSLTLLAVIAVLVPRDAGAQSRVAAVASGTPDETSVLARPARLSVERVTLKEALDALQQSSGVLVAYSSALLPSGRNFACDCMGVTVEEAMQRLLGQTGLDYIVMADQLVIRERRAPAPLPSAENGTWTARLAVNTTSSAPRGIVNLRPVVLLVGTITGRVVDAATQQPLGTVQVHIPALEIGTLTRPDGFYTIPNVPAGTHELVAEVIGYRSETQQVTVRDDSTVTVNFQLAQTAVSLEEVVAVGYGQQTRATVSGSVSSVSSEKLEGQAFTNATDAIAGLVQGVSIRQAIEVGQNSGQTTTPGTGDQIMGESLDGRPGAPSAIQIRNMGSPLIVIDGVPSTIQDFNNLNPADIESLSVLKDASAAVYGFRAANGVLLVTTKRGNPLEQPRVRVDAAYGWQNFTRYHYKPLTNAYELNYNFVESQLNREQPQELTPEQLELYRIGAPGYESTDHWPLAINNPNAAQYNVNANVSGGMGNAQYYLSVGHVQQDYSMRDYTWGRTNLAANVRTDLTDRFTIGTELRAHNEVRDEISLLGNPSNVHTALLIVQSSWPHDDPFIGPNNNLMNHEVRYDRRSVGTMAQSVSGQALDRRRQASGNFWAEYRLPFGTTVKGTFSVRLNARDFDLARKAFDQWCTDKENNTYYICWNSGDRTRQQLVQRDEGVFANITASHSQGFGLHSFSGAAFFELDGSESNMTYVIAQLPTNYTKIIDYTRLSDLGNTWSITRRASLGGRLDYDYDRKYLFSALARYDGSYLYAPGKRWGLFPGVSFGWRVTEEDFMQGRFGFLNDLKLRVSWGQTGREQGVSAWGYLGGATYGVDGTVLDGNLVEGVQPRGLPVTNLSWVTSTSKNIGFDALMLDGRLSAEVDFFVRELSGLPAARSDVLLPNELGYSLPNENLNSDETRGFEVAVTWSDRVGRVQYSLSPNMTIARTMPTFRYMQRFGNSWHEYRNGNVGRWESVNFGYKVIGHFQSVEEIESYPVLTDNTGNRLLLPGDLIYEDVNGDGIINAMDERPIGYCTTCTPILSFGLGSSVRFMGLSLTVNFAGGTMYDHARGAESKALSLGGHNSPKYSMDRWMRVDPFNPQSEWRPGRYPPIRINATNPSYNRNDTFWRTNVRFARLRRLELGYNVPDHIAGTLGLSSLRIYTNLQNAFSWDNTQHYNQDPEMVRDAGLSYPTTRLFNIGFSANVGGGIRTTVAGGD